MATIYPPDARAKDAPDGPEQYVLDLLRSQLDDSWHVVPNLRIASHPRHLDGEADVVLIHAKGVIVLEVKGGRISRTSYGEWIQNDVKRLTSPIMQASENMHAVHDYLKAEIGRSFPICFCCVFPQSIYGVCTIEVDDGQIIDAVGIRMAGLGVLLEAFLDDFRLKYERKIGPSGALSRDDLDRMAVALNPPVAGTATPSMSVSLTKLELSHLEPKQIDHLPTLVRNDRVCLDGAAGTGKTALGLFACFERLKANPGIRGAFICWSDYLANDIRKKVQEAGFGERLQVFARQNQHSMDSYFWSEIYDRKTSFEIEVSLALDSKEGLLCCVLGRNPGELTGDDLLRFVAACSDDGLFEGITVEDPLMSLEEQSEADFEHDKRFDFIAIDEGQDFLNNRPALTIINMMVKGGLLKGRVLWIQDILQAIRGRFDSSCDADTAFFDPENAGYVLLPLPDKNYRNPVEVAKAAAVFRGNGEVISLRLPSLRPSISYLETPDGDLGIVMQAVDALLDSGVSPDDILLVSVDASSMAKFAAGFKLGRGRYLAVVPPNLDPTINTNSGGKFIRCCDIMDAKGREFPIVILVDLPSGSTDSDRSLLYVAMTRCTDSLYVAGSPEKLSLFKGFFGSQPMARS
jgi:hypothetical protein